MTLAGMIIKIIMFIPKKVNLESSPAASVGIEKHQPRSIAAGLALLKKQKRR